MHRWKNIVLLFLSVLMIAICAALPQLVSYFQDSAAIGQVRYDAVPNIQLQIRSDGADDPFKKLAMMGRMDGGLEISEQMASMSREEAEAQALEILHSFIDAGLIQEFEPVIHDSYSMLATVTLDPSLNGIYWMVTVVSADDYNYAQLDLAIDDESGAALAVSFASERSLSAVERREKLDTFTEIYFTSLGIPDYAHFVSEDMNGAYIGQKACAVRYHYVDDGYGEITADFYAYEYGFYTEFPSRGR